MKNQSTEQLVIQKATLNRLPLYYCYLKDKMEKDNLDFISSTTIAGSLHLNAIQVRKDLAFVSQTAGKPHKGFEMKALINDIENYLGYNNVNEAIIVGIGRLGHTLLAYKGFQNYGLHIVAGFDNDNDLVGIKVNDRPIFPIDKLYAIINRLQINIGIITVPAENAQEICNMMVKAGIKAIWNFAPIHLEVPNGILVQYENLAASLAKLSKELLYSLQNK